MQRYSAINVYTITNTWTMEQCKRRIILHRVRMENRASTNKSFVFILFHTETSSSIWYTGTGHTWTVIIFSVLIIFLDECLGTNVEWIYPTKSTMIWYLDCFYMWHAAAVVGSVSFFTVIQNENRHKTPSIEIIKLELKRNTLKRYRYIIIVNILDAVCGRTLLLSVHRLFDLSKRNIQVFDCELCSC